MSRRRTLIAVVAAAIVIGGLAGVLAAETRRPTASSRPPVATKTPSPVGSPSPGFSSPGPQDTASAAPTCATRDLRARVVNVESATGSTLFGIRLRNVSDRTCRLNGYGGLSFVGPGGRQIGNAASRDSSQGGPGPVTLAPHESAIADVRQAAAANFSTADCRPRRASALRVFPPNQTASILVLHSTVACAGVGVQQLSIRPYVHQP